MQMSNGTPNASHAQVGHFVCSADKNTNKMAALAVPASVVHSADAFGQHEVVKDVMD